MAYVRRRVLKDEKTVTYLAVWREEATGKEVSRSFARKGDADRFVVDIRHRMLTGTYASPRLGKTPFREVATRYLAQRNWRPRTAQSAEERVRYAVAYFDQRGIGTIRRGDVQSFVSSLNLAPSTIRVVMQHVTAVFNTAIDDGLIASRNPCAGVRLPSVDSPPVFPVTTEQVEALRAQADPSFAIAIVLGAGLGLRQSEAAGLSVDRVEFLRRTIRVDRQWQQSSASRSGAFVAPKTETSTRVVPADAWVLEQLASHVRRFGTGRDGMVLHHDGRPYDAARFGYYVRAARKRAGLTDSVSFHDLRHFFASALINAGCSVKQVQSALGHKSAKVTLDVYGHLWPGEDDRVRNAIGALFRPGGGEIESVG